MKDNIFDLLNHTKLFSEGCDKVIKISSNKYKVCSGERDYVLGLYDYEEYKYITEENTINKILEEIGLEPLRVYEAGIMPDINKSYKIFDFRDELSLGDFLPQASPEEVAEVGENFGILLRKFHSIKLDDRISRDWYKFIVDRQNFLLYQMGIQKNKSNRDYILVDYLNSNVNLTKHTSENLLYSNLNLKNIRLYDKNKLDLRGLKKLEVGDGITDFVEVNKIAIDYPNFSRAIYAGYFNNKMPSRKFFRLLSYYQALDLLDQVVKARTEVNGESKEREVSIEKVLEMYDYFSRIEPSRLKV